MSDIFVPAHKLVIGIVQVTGEHDVGKTTFALEAIADPTRAFFIDSDVKGRATVQQMVADGLKFGRYEDLIQLERKTSGNELLFHDAVVSMIEAVKPGAFDVLIWDTFRRFEKTFIPIVEAHPDRYRKVWSSQPVIRAKERKSEGVELTAHFLGSLQEKFPLIIICTHLKDDYTGDVRTGKQVPDNNRTLDRVCRMRIWLKRNPSGSPVPVGLLLKRLDKKIMSSQGLRTQSVLPQKITPGLNFATGEIDVLDDVSLWDTIRRYMAHPVANRKLWPDETPDAYELSILEGTLTEDQKMVLKMNAAALTNEKIADQVALSAAADRARVLFSEGLTPPVVVQTLLTEIETGELDADPTTITIPAVLGWSK